MEVVDLSSSSGNPNEDIYPVKTKKQVSKIVIDERDTTQRCSDFSDFPTEALGEIGFAFKHGADDSNRTRSTYYMDDSTRTRSTRLSFSGRYDYDLQTENDELRLELISVRGEVDDLKLERENLKSHIAIMNMEIAHLQEQLRVRDAQLVNAAIATTSSKRPSFEAESSPAGATKRPSLVGRLFRGTSSRKQLITDEDEVEDQELLDEVSLVPSAPPSEVGSPTKNHRRPSLLKRFFSGKSFSSEIVSDDSVNNNPQEEEEEDLQLQEEEEEEGHPIQYVDWQRDTLPSRERPVVSQVTMAGYMNSILEDQDDELETTITLPVYESWNHRDLIKKQQSSSSNDGDSEMNSTVGEEEEEEVEDFPLQEVPATTTAATTTPVLNIKWERDPATPVLNIQWDRIPSNRNLVTDNDEQEEPPVLKSCLKSPGGTTIRKTVKKSATVFSPTVEQEVEETPRTKAKRGIKIRESINEVNEVFRIRGSAWDNCFFTEDELAGFKYNAFLEECGLDDDDF